MIDDQTLTEHFRLYELTRTDRTELQQMNRLITPFQIAKLTVLAKLLEHVRFVLGTPLTIHSGYRCPELNRAVGSGEKSQHLLCEAADFVPGQQDLGNAFRTLWRDVKDNNTNVGQLIHESTNRYGIHSWIHISLGSPYREDERNKEILRMQDGVYTRLA